MECNTCEVHLIANSGLPCCQSETESNRNSKLEKWYLHFVRFDELFDMVLSNLAFEVVCHNVPFWPLLYVHLHHNCIRFTHWTLVVFLVYSCKTSGLTNSKSD